ncbi:hypothetical protein FE257_012426 [Aspergillus nanangensis]|uniref:F-box domain-containing protein n=1 Tax=Aspergillus nanangensis TaxID=2582783 RepID=A0AAD4CUL2_ASPNN|nr:hypothetical protein FE257_012426 [Aspergillus nanangensis]
MSVTWSALESLPNELLDGIIASLSAPPPSLYKLHQPPCARISKCETHDLKNLSRASSRLREVLLPRLFSHACFDLQDTDAFLLFVCTLDLGRYVTSIVVKGRHSPGSREDPFWWRQVLSRLDPLRVTVIAPPSFLGAMMGTQIMDGHSWAFQVSLQILQLERDNRGCDATSSLDYETCSSLMEAGPWSTLLFNESSSLKAYNHYEYFLFQVPSLFSKWGSAACSKSRQEQKILCHSLNTLTSFRYTAVFPFYNHVKLVLNVVELMENLQALSVQLAPGENDKATELEQRGSMDPSDPWMEIATGYSLIAHSVKEMGFRGGLVEFHVGDYSFDALRPELSIILEDVLGNTDWIHDGRGTWTRNIGHTPIPATSMDVTSSPLPTYTV